MKLDKKYCKDHLTYDTATSQNYMWIEDMKKFELLSEIEVDVYIKQIQDYEYVIGQPAHDVTPELYIGLYKKLLPNLPIDETLTPENAESRGCEWVGDSFYDREGPLKMMGNIINLVSKDGYKLGGAAGTMGGYQGLYATLKK